MLKSKITVILQWKDQIGINQEKICKVSVDKDQRRLKKCKLYNDHELDMIL